MPSLVQIGLSVHELEVNIHTPTISILVGFEVLTAASIEMTVFWVVPSCSLHGATTQKTAIFNFNFIYKKKAASALLYVCKTWIQNIKACLQRAEINYDSKEVLDIDEPMKTEKI
jgi:hypothetical protein